MTHGLDTSLLVAVEVACHPDHPPARTLVDSLHDQGDQFAVAAQVLAEFVHIVTDPKRFTAPLTLAQALERAQAWWDASDVQRVWPDEAVVSWFFAAMSKHRLGRKRVLDTFLAATFHSAGISSVVTLNATDFAVFGEFKCVPLPPPGAEPQRNAQPPALNHQPSDTPSPP